MGKGILNKFSAVSCFLNHFIITADYSMSFQLLTWELELLYPSHVCPYRLLQLFCVYSKFSNNFVLKEFQGREAIRNLCSDP